MPQDSFLQQNGAAKAAWAQIQQRMKPPLCKGHNEPCVIRQVKKGGPNQGALCLSCPSLPLHLHHAEVLPLLVFTQHSHLGTFTVCAGRVFYVCRRAAGNPPEGRCDYFLWAGSREIRGAKSESAKSAGAMSLKKAWN